MTDKEEYPWSSGRSPDEIERDWAENNPPYLGDPTPDELFRYKIEGTWRAWETRYWWWSFFIAWIFVAIALSSDAHPGQKAWPFHLALLTVVAVWWVGSALGAIILGLAKVEWKHALSLKSSGPTGTSGDVDHWINDPYEHGG